MTEGPSLLDSAQQTPKRVLIPLLLVLAIVGHVAWFAAVDPSPAPFLPDQAAEARAEVSRVFPNATAPVARVVLVADDGGNVLTAEALTALAGLRNRLSSDPEVTQALSRRAPVSSVLEVLDPHLEGAPGEWDQQDVDSALENATRTSEGQRALALYLDRGATLRGAETRAEATVLVVRLAAGLPAPGLAGAQATIASRADELALDGIEAWTDAPATRVSGARSLAGWWVPTAAVGLLVIAGLTLRGRPTGIGRWTLLWTAAAGTGLLVGVVVDQATPVALTVAHLGAGLGLAGLITWPAGQRAWLWTATVPLVALSGWAPVGIGELAVVAVGSLLTVPLAASLWPAPDDEAASDAEPAPEPRPPSAPGRWQALALAGVLLGSLTLLAGAGLPESAEPGWEGTLSTRTDAGKAEVALEAHFQGAGPASEFALAAWGPVAEPGFLAALDESGERLSRLSLAATGGQVHSVLALAQDWATDETAEDPADDYDAGFARLWANATDGGSVPVEDVDRVLERLGQLDPEGTRQVLAMDPAPATTGVALTEQRVSFTDVVPRPGQAVQAALQPLLAASEQVAVTGPALDEQSTEEALLDARTPVALATLAATLLAGLAWALRPRPGAPLVAALTAASLGACLVVLATLSLVATPVRPAALLAPALAASTTLLLAGPLISSIGQRASEGTPLPLAVEERLLAGRSVPPGVAIPLAAALVAALTVQAPGLRADALVLALGALVGLAGAGWATPTLSRRWSVWADEGREHLEPEPGGPVPAHTVCPVCQRQTATGASRCHSCGRWNTVEACPAHPEALAATCAACGADLEPPRFG